MNSKLDVDAFKWIAHSYALRLVRIKGIVENIDPLRVGAGRAITLHEPTDLVVVKVYDPKKDAYVPLIPGSSWKGLFRASAVKLLRTYGIVTVCDGVPRASCLRGNEFDNIERSGGGFYDKLGMLVRGEIPCCLLCLMFGSPGLASHVTFFDSYPLSDVKLGYRTMIAIDRRTGATTRGALFTVEYIEPGANFSFEVDLFNMPNYCIGIISQIIMDIHNGIIRVGGLKSRGFGTVMFKELKFEVIIPKEVESKGELPPLDPYDTPVKLEEDGFEQLKNFIEAWNKVRDKLKEISERRWRWI